MYISQPAVIKSIKKLEKYLGGDLFIRTTKGLVPTEECEKLNSTWYTAFKFIENGVDNFTNVSKSIKGKIIIGSSSTIIRKILMSFIMEFSKKYPNISINIVDANSQKLIKYLKRGEIDFAILNTPFETNEIMEYVVIKKTEDCFISSVNFEKDFICKDDLNKYPLIVQKRPSNNRDYFEQICVENKIQLMPQYEIASFGLITDFVEKNLGIAFTVKDFVQDDIDKKRVKIINTDLCINPRELVVANLKQNINSYTKKTFYNFLVSYFK